jgi:LDH2 family malate/lactate/ureidoglycolate dehydrogenase
VTAEVAPRDQALRLRPDKLRDDVERVLRAAGADGEAAAIVAGSLVASDLCGASSHGCMRVPEYLDAIRRGRIIPAARPRVETDLGSVVALDGQGSFGQVAARELSALAAERAQRHGVAVVTLAGVAHVGRLGEWVERVAADGMIALGWCNCGHPYGNVVPFGGREARLGTNPLAYALPAGSRPPVVADFSTSVVAEGKVRLFLHRGEQVPDGWLLDSDGEPTNDPEALYRGGAILPAAGHKGYALALLVEVLGGVLAGAGCASVGDAPGNGVVLMAVDPRQVRPQDDFGERVAAVLASIADSSPASSARGVKIPGQPEAETRARRLAQGIPVAAQTWATLIEAARGVGVELRFEQTSEGDERVV